MGIGLSNVPSKARRTISDSIGQLTGLTDLILYTNNVAGTIPSAIGQLTNLQNLFLVGDIETSGGVPDHRTSNLTGTLPSTIGLLTKLSNLEIATNKLTGPIPSEIGHLTRLNELYLIRNFLTGTIPLSLANLKNLTSIYLSENKLTGVVPPLPFHQYIFCYFDEPGECKDPLNSCNHFSCPLPPNSKQCNSSQGPGKNPPGIHCH
jgi:Leucine-rich repeat (LRR) protein